MKAMQKTHWIWMGVLGVGLLATSVFAEGAHVILQDGRRLEGTSIRARANGDVILTTARGDLTFPRGEYREARAPRPQELDRARQQFRAGNYDAVISTLEDLVRQYRHLSWDVEALAMIGRAQTQKSDYSAAMSTFNQLFQRAPDRREDSEVRWPYYRALMGAGELSRLERDLDELIAEGDRSDAARAQIMRGDIKKQRDLADAALLDYLRTVVLFQAQTEVQAEALYKAGVVLDERRDPRARDMFRKVIENHADSRFARQARERM